MHTQLSKNFNSKEFDSPDIKFSGKNISLDLIVKLQSLRDLYKKPIVIISGVRSKQHNLKIGGVPNSAHVIFQAADIKVNNSHDRFLLLKLALQVGFNRIGINKNSLHLDVSKSGPQNVIWDYY